MRRACRIPRPGDGVARIAGQPLHRARDADFHLRAHGGGRCAQARARARHPGIGRGTGARATGQPARRRMRAVQREELGRRAAEPVLPSLVRAARRQVVDRRPVWFMRQAGRSLPEYRKVREQYDLFTICQKPELCAEVTMQPVRRLGVDGAVLFADIMLPVAFGLGVDLQLEAGAQVVQVFDSWVGCLSPMDYRRYVLPYMTRIFAELQRAAAPAIHFATGTAGILSLMREAGGHVIGLDWRVDLGDAWRIVGYDRAVQGNLDPALLLGPWPVIEDGARRVIEAAGGRPGHIFNLGHGVLPDTPVEHLQRLTEFVHAA